MNNSDNRDLKEAFGDDKKKKWLKDNPRLTPNQIDIYIKWFDDIRKSRPAAAKTVDIDGVPKGNDRFDISKYSDWHSFESFVDAVRAKTQLKGEKLSNNLEIDAKPLFEKNGLEVYYADTPQACIKYKGSIPYSWCVARPDSSNMFYNYRLGYDNPAFYFVKDVEATKKELSSGETFSGDFSNPWHFFVIQVLKTAYIDDLTDKNYVVTSANNDGDIRMNWNEIVKIQPKLNGLQHEFLPKPLSKEENKIINKYRNGLSLDEFIKLPYNEKERFLDIYPTQENPITDGIFNALPDELKNKYIGMNIVLSDKQYNSIKSNKNLLKRYAQIAKRKFEESSKDPDFQLWDFVASEIDVLHKYGILDVSQLTDDNVYDILSNRALRANPVDMLLNNNVPLTPENVKNLVNYSPNKQHTIDTLLSKNVPLTPENVKNLVNYSPNKQQTIDTLLNNNVSLTDSNVSRLIWDELSTNQQKARFNALKVKQLGALKLKQQLSETKFKYRDFFSDLK